MKFEEKKELIMKKNFGLWLKIRRETFDRLSDGQSVCCVCGRLATGLHEMSCKKFNDKVDRETVKKICSELNIK